MLGVIAAIVAWAEVVDRVAAEVGDEIILSSDVALEADLGRIDPSAWTRRQPDPLARLIDGAVLRAAAGDLRLYQPSAREVDAAVAELHARMGERAWRRLLDRHGASERQVEVALRRHLIETRFLARAIASGPETAAWAPAVDAVLAPARAAVRVRIIAESDR